MARPLFLLCQQADCCEEPASFFRKAEQDPWFLEQQLHQPLDTTSEPQNRKLNTQFTRTAAHCPGNVPGVLSCTLLLALTLREPSAGKGATGAPTASLPDHIVLTCHFPFFLSL